jgi:hypothetical protein
MSLEIKFGFYRPEIDREFKNLKLPDRPFQDTFGSDSFFISTLGLDYLLWTGFGSLGIGGSMGYLDAGGKGLLKNGEKSSDSTSFSIIPFTASIVYRFDYLAQKFSIPLSFYGRIGLDYYLWWTTNGVGEISRFEGSSGRTYTGMGGVFGWHYNAGLQLLLDIFAPEMATTFDNELGVNNTYLFIEYYAAYIDDFGSKTSMQLGDRTFMFGIMFDF